ncbi:efflux RND transporter permease subunit [Brumicola nitratireducens]|uniref:Putative exporter, RND superfamily protein n=1 Tax=Glaciecola nitratireducens (strain JCM 12485 / KCTC 12276 / FR1064) TaxID=1085623 RepID=G4QN75_GLANF|nr:MMPL family transporter [Glaciecola nitratireducens]AEP31494.1 putative exporter, RND superfamily protein [Glaciecola nitratireducens FR1064]
MSSTHLSTERIIEKMMFANRKLILFILTIIFAFLATEAIQVKPEASFSKMVPGDHEFINNYKAYQSELADLGNVIRVIVETEEGDIFTQEFQQTLRQVTDDVFFIPGVNRNALKSLWTPSVRWQEVTEEGFVGGAVVPDGYDGSDSMLEQLKTNVFKSGQVGVLVGNDFKSAIVLAPLQEKNPETGLPLDYRELSEKLEQDIRDKYDDDTINIRIVGFAKVVGDLIDGAVQVVIFFGLAVVITFVLLLLYSRCLRSTIVVLVFSILAVISQLGILNLLGFGVNPYSMLVPFLVFAIGVSHGVQIITGIIQHVKTGSDKFNASKLAFRSLYLAGITALVSDAIGFTTLMVIDIGVIRELAIAASIGVAVIIITNLVALPIVISFIGVSTGGRARHTNSASAGDAASANKLAASIAGFARPPKAKYALVVAVLLSMLGLYYSQFLKIGDLDAGAPELRADSRYNLDNAYVVENYSTSTDVFVVMAKTTPDTCITYDNLTWIDKLQWEVKNVNGVQDVKSVANVSKFGMFGMNEGSLKWYGLNRNQFMTNASVSRTPPGLINQDCSMVPILIFLDDHKADTLEAVVAKVQAFKGKYDSGDVEFLLAAGNAGVEAVTNMVIEDAQTEMLIWVYSVVIALCLITFRSVRTVIAIILPLMLTSLLSQALMAKLGIGVKVATLPVIALGVGIGVDYGIYIFSKINEALAQRKSLYDSYLFALNQTGKAVAFTGLTLAIGVATWVFSPIKFQADMGLLLTFMFILNMVGALTLIPAIAWLLRIGANNNTESENPSEEPNRV